MIIRFFLALFLLHTLSMASTTLKFAVLKFSDAKESQQQYIDLVEYLNAHLKNNQIELLFLSRDEMGNALNRNQIELLTTNPSHFEMIRNQSLLTRVIASTQHIEKGIKTENLGGVIFTLSSNRSYQSFNDVKGKTIASMDVKSLGAYQAQAYEYLQKGIDITKTSKIIHYQTQNEIVDAVLSHKADIGFIRTGIVESMVQQHKIKLDQIRILHPQSMGTYPYFLSTRLYPEWPVFIMPHVDENLAKELSILLLTYRAQENKKSSTLAFTLPQNYSSVRDLMKALSIPPFDHNNEITWQEVYDQYKYQILAASFFAISLILAFLQIMRLHVRLRFNEERFNLAMEGTRDGLFDWDMVTNEMFHSKNFEILLGYSGDELPQTLKAWEENVHPEDLAPTYRTINDYIHSKGKGVFSTTFRMRTKNGSWKWIEGRGKVIFDTSNRPIRFVGFNSDITEKKEHEIQLEYAAGHDLLTDLPNRSLLSSLMPKFLASAKRHNKHLALLFIDLDGFKEVNDTHGHDAGDLLLQQISSRMQSLLRGEDIVARLGGDEFALLISNLNDRDEIIHLVTRLLKTIAEPCIIKHKTVNISASIGISFYPQAEEVDADLLLRQADQAMYDAKFNGKNQYHCFDDEHNLSIKLGNDQFSEIMHAIHHDELVLHYQPKVNMQSGEIIGAEALIRWNHPSRGMLYPDSFLPYIENRPAIYELDRWVINRAFKDLTHFKDQGFGDTLRFSINLSAYAFRQKDLFSTIEGFLNDYPQVSPSQIEFEILETSALQNIDEVQSIIASLHAIGITVALDDFGTGYASLSYLKKLNVDHLKIDRSFIFDILHDSGDLRILEATVGLADAFRSSVIAEGVETEAHGEMLIQFGCYLAQGYVIAKPMPVHQLIEWSKVWVPYPSWQQCAPVAQKYYPFLYAATEHRGWYNHIRSFIHGQSAQPPELNHTLCQFGKWLQTEGKFLIGDTEHYLALDGLHRELHDVSKHIIEEMGKELVDVSSMDAFYKLHTDLLASLSEILKRSQVSNSPSF